MVRGLTFLLLFQFSGEAVSRIFDLPIPGNVLGMGFLLLGLTTKLVDIKWFEEAAEFLLSNMALFFVPAGVGVMVYSDLIAAEWLPITVATVLSTFVVMAVTGKIAQNLESSADDDGGEDA
jgi:holin-like protein